MTQTQLNLYGVDKSLRKFTSSEFQKRCLGHLAWAPHAVWSEGPTVIGELCEWLGRFFETVAHEFDDHHGPNFEADILLGERAECVKALARQFSWVGQQFKNKTPAELQMRVVRLSERVKHLEHMWMHVIRPQLAPDSHKIDVPEWMRLKPQNEKYNHRQDLMEYRNGGVL